MHYRHSRPLRYTAIVNRDDLRQRLTEARLEKGWSMSKVARGMTRRLHDSGHLPPDKEITRGYLNHYEKGKHWPDDDAVDAWAATLGFRVVRELVEQDAGLSGPEVVASLSRLSADDQRVVMLCADLLARLEGVPLAMLRGYVEQLAQASEVTTAQSA